MSLSWIESAQLIKQGAEAKVYKVILYPAPTLYYPSYSDLTPTTAPIPIPVLLKYRFPKRYRHPTLDSTLTRQRLAAEARALVRCAKYKVNVPGLRSVDHRQGVLGIEWIEGSSVREVLGGGQDDDEGAFGSDADDGEGEEEEEEEDEEGEASGNDTVVRDRLRKLGIEDDALLESIGMEIAKMHLADVIHGDLTTSNMMVRLKPESATRIGPIFDLVLIDFGLSSITPLAEDRAVDLYVLERAFASTHPIPLLASGVEGIPHFDTVLAGYRKTMELKGKKGEWKAISRKLESVRGRGRKRSMVG